MGPLVHPTNRDRFTACPSVRPERFQGICQRTHRGNGLKFYMLVYLDHLQNWLVCATVCWFFKFWHYFVLVKRVKFGVSGHFPENAWRNGLKSCTLMYLDHLQNWLVYGQGLLIFLILALFWLSEGVKFGVSGHFPENAWRKWPEIVHADVSWPPAEQISWWSRSVDFSNFGTILT